MLGTCLRSTVLSLILCLLVEFAFGQLSFATTTTPLASPLAIGDKVVAKKRHALDL